MPLSMDQLMAFSAPSSLETELVREEKELLKSGLDRIKAIATSFFELEIEEDQLQREVCVARHKFLNLSVSHCFS